MVMEEILKASLGDYDHIGFRLKEIGDNKLLELRFMGKHVEYFSSVDTTIVGLHEACQEYLRQQVFGGK